MPENDKQQVLTAWPGAIETLVAEMKRRAGVTTDSGLARFMGMSQATVSHWRKRGKVPEPALLKFELLLEAPGDAAIERSVAARVLALRVPEFWYQSALASGAAGGRAIFYRKVATAFPDLVDQAYAQLTAYEREMGQETWEIAVQLLEDKRFMESLIASLKRES